jgi:integrase
MPKAMAPRLIQRGKMWYVAYKRDGRSQRDSLRTEDLQVAEKRFQGWLEQRVKQTPSSNPLVDDCLDLWFEQWIEGRMLAESRYPSLINNLKHHFGGSRVQDLTREDARRYTAIRRRGDIGRCGAADGTIRKELQCLRAAFNFMCDRVEPLELRIDRMTLPYVELPPPSPPRERVLTDDEVQSCLDYVDDLARKSNRLPRITRFVYMARYTAQRKTAILELPWSRVYIDRKQINFLPSGRLQTSKRRPFIPMDDRLAAMLERAAAESVSKLVMDSSKNINNEWQKMVRAVKIDGLTPHVFRHTWATKAAMDGIAMDKIAAFLGDTVATVEKNYKHLSPEYLTDVVNR